MKSRGVPGTEFAGQPVLRTGLAAPDELQRLGIRSLGLAQVQC